MISEITSLSNAKVKAWAKLKEKKYRDKEQCFLIEGEHLIQEAYAAGWLDCVIVLKGSAYPDVNGIPVYEVTKEIIHKLTSLTSMETLLGVSRFPSYDSSSYSRIVVLDGVQDPGNLGTIIRTAISFGYEAIVLSQDCVDVYNEKVVRSTQGALFHIPMIRGDLSLLLPNFKQQGMTLYATALRNAKPLSNIIPASSYALIFGNEGSGVRNQTLELCDETIKIEMETFESLNVAVAAGICMYEFIHFR